MRVSTLNEVSIFLVFDALKFILCKNVILFFSEISMGIFWCWNLQFFFFLKNHMDRSYLKWSTKFFCVHLCENCNLVSVSLGGKNVDLRCLGAHFCSVFIERKYEIILKKDPHTFPKMKMAIIAFGFHFLQSKRSRITRIGCFIIEITCSS